MSLVLVHLAPHGSWPPPIPVADRPLFFLCRLTRNSALLQHSFEPAPAVAAAARVGPAYPTSQDFGSLVRQRWNQVISGAVAGVRDTDWTRVGSAALGGASEVAGRIGSAASSVSDSVGAATNSAASSASATATQAAASDIAGVGAGVIGAGAAVAVPTDQVKEDKKKLDALRRDTAVDAPARPSPKITDAPKRLV